MRKKVLTTVLTVVVLACAGCKSKIVEVPLVMVQTDMGIAAQVAMTKPAVVHVINEAVGCQGSGVIVAQDLVVTAKHVVEYGKEFTMTLDDGTKLKSDKVLVNKAYDVAFIQVQTDKILPIATLGQYSHMSVGEAVYVIGSPLGIDNFNSVSLGVVSAVQRDLDAIEDSGLGWHVMFQSDTAAYPGNSGGPVFNMRGEVVGLLIAGHGPGLNYSVPVDVFVADLENVQLWFAIDRYFWLEGAKPDYITAEQVESMLRPLEQEIAQLREQLEQAKVRQKKPQDVNAPAMEDENASRDGESTETEGETEGS